MSMRGTCPTWTNQLALKESTLLALADDLGICKELSFEHNGQPFPNFTLEELKGLLPTELEDALHFFPRVVAMSAEVTRNETFAMTFQKIRQEKALASLLALSLNEDAHPLHDRSKNISLVEVMERSFLRPERVCELIRQELPKNNEEVLPHFVKVLWAKMQNSQMTSTTISDTAVRMARLVIAGGGTSDATQLEKHGLEVLSGY
jgi:hypothetical protein